MRKFIFRGRKINGEWLENGICFGVAVLPASVGQFTGLTDKNGTEIFEKDIIKYINEDGKDVYMSVEFEDGCFVYNEYAFDGTVFSDVLRNAISLGIEVVGNVTDNPELIQRN